MNSLFVKILRSNRLSAEEILNIGKQLTKLADLLRIGGIPNAVEMSSTVSALCVFALASPEQKEEVLAFTQWFLQPVEHISWSEGLLTIVSRFFGEVQMERIGELLFRISAQKSLTDVNRAEALVSSLSDPGMLDLYDNRVDALNIDFSVAVLPFSSEVLEPRIVTVKPGKANEKHKHAHETVFIFLKGKGTVIVDEFQNEVQAGSFAFIPRWSIHQSVNTGMEDLVFLAVADFGLTGKSFVGNYIKTARLKSKNDSI